mmetsp:Transcript_92225/g.176894  ORF Transcript_92225/g.176894 Transcript_92225/m.176894 type:complete len:149 (-) Transcript_92225:939-1385(-)
MIHCTCSVHEHHFLPQEGFTIVWPSCRLPKAAVQARENPTQTIRDWPRPWALGGGCMVVRSRVAISKGPFMSNSRNSGIQRVIGAVCLFARFLRDGAGSAKEPGQNVLEDSLAVAPPSQPLTELDSQPHQAKICNAKGMIAENQEQKH